MKRSFYFFLTLILLSSCNDKNPAAVPQANILKDTIAIQTKNTESSIEGTYETQSEGNDSDDCKVSLEINKTKAGYSYFLKTKTRQLKGIANFKKEDSGEKYLILEGIK